VLTKQALLDLRLLALKDPVAAAMSVRTELEAEVGPLAKSSGTAPHSLGPKATDQYHLLVKAARELERAKDAQAAGRLVDLASEFLAAVQARGLRMRASATVVGPGGAESKPDAAKASTWSAKPQALRFLKNIPRYESKTAAEFRDWAESTSDMELRVVLLGIVGEKESRTNAVAQILTGFGEHADPAETPNPIFSDPSASDADKASIFKFDMGMTYVEGMRSRTEDEDLPDAVRQFYARCVREEDAAMVLLIRLLPDLRDQMKPGWLRSHAADLSRR
jgi:hypothetical protein